MEVKTINIGRLEQNDIVINDMFVSRVHCQIIVNQDVYYVQDLNSANGVSVNGKIIKNTKVKVETDDIIKIGKTLIRWTEYIDEQKKNPERIQWILNEAGAIINAGEIQDNANIQEQNNENAEAENNFQASIAQATLVDNNQNEKNGIPATTWIIIGIIVLAVIIVLSLIIK